MLRSAITWMCITAVSLGCHSGKPKRAPAVAPKSQAPTTQSIEQKASLPARDYSAEKYRIVNQPDEIVAVLEDGATVIAKRVDSPVVAMRAYTYTGGVYEGKWLGG